MGDLVAFPSKQSPAAPETPPDFSTVREALEWLLATPGPTFIVVDLSVPNGLLQLPAFKGTGVRLNISYDFEYPLTLDDDCLRTTLAFHRLGFGVVDCVIPYASLMAFGKAPHIFVRDGLAFAHRHYMEKT